MKTIFRLRRNPCLKRLGMVLFAAALIVKVMGCSSNSEPVSSGVHEPSVLDGYNFGQVERLYELDQRMQNVPGMAFQEDSSGRFLHFFEGVTGIIHTYEVDSAASDLVFSGTISIQASPLVNPRGFTYAREVSGDVFYFLDYEDGQAGQKKGLLYRYDVDNKDLTFLDLRQQLGDKEVFGVTKQGDNLYVSYDPGSYDTHSLRVRRGLLSISVADSPSVTADSNGQTVKRPLDWHNAVSGKPVVNGYMPGPGPWEETADISESDQLAILNGYTTETGEKTSSIVHYSRALTAMTIENTNYLWGTVGNEYLYLLDSKSGRGIFFFDRPGSTASNIWDTVAYGGGNLWVAEQVSDKLLVYRLNVLDSMLVQPEEKLIRLPILPDLGTKRLREMIMEITSEAVSDVPSGNVYHTFCHPYSDSAIILNQGVLNIATEVNNLTPDADYTVANLYLNPAGDPANMQHYTQVTYPVAGAASGAKYRTEFYISLWTREVRQVVWPHLVQNKHGGPVGTNYLDDDNVLYGIVSDPESYADFIDRVIEAIADKHELLEPEQVSEEMENPYWAARNIVEYILDHYHYPNDDPFFAYCDFDSGHYNSHPGNLKAALSADDRWDNNIIACSGTGALVAGTLRSIGIPSIWVGSSQESKKLIPNEALFLTHGVEAEVSNGHRWNKVWLGFPYGWQDIDATPRRPEELAYDQKPAEISQVNLMNRVFHGVTGHRIIHNMQSEFWDRLHIPCRPVAIYDMRNPCGSPCGSVRYNLLGSYDHPGSFRPSRHKLRTRAIQFVENISVGVWNSTATITWDTDGRWDLDPEATLVIDLLNSSLEQVGPPLASGLPYDLHRILVNLDGYDPGTYHVRITKHGDPLIGNICGGFSFPRPGQVDFPHIDERIVEVDFPYPLDAIILETLGKPKGPIFSSDLEKLTCLDAPESKITDITGLEHCTKLTQLNLANNQIRDISPLADLTNLNELLLSGNLIDDISPLVDNKKLGAGSTVDLSDNPLNPDSLDICIPQLEARGVNVIYFQETPSHPSPPMVSLDAISNIVLGPGQTHSLDITVFPGDAAIKVSSSNSSIVAVKESGKKITVTGHTAGMTTITVEAQKTGYVTRTRTFQVTVDPVKEFKIGEQKITPGNSLVIVTLWYSDPQNYIVQVGKVELEYYKDLKAFVGEVPDNKAKKNNVQVTKK